MKRISLLIFGLLIIVGSFAQSQKIKPSKNCYKPIENSNPISPVLFCADPTGIVYNDRLYVYGTNDHQQYQFAGLNGKNTYDKIKSLVVFSTADMVNWRFEGYINVKDVAPWTINSWAPSICSRVEDDGETHFYLYYSNNGCGVGVITATNPVGPWFDPRGSALIMAGDSTVGDVPNPFDPGVCIDIDAIGWLAFGGGKSKNGTDAMPGTARIARLGKDMISLDTVVEIKAPYFYEASEMNYLRDGIYMYTYNTSWTPRTEWNYKIGPEPSQCSMAYMTTQTPLVTDSWKYGGHYFPNPGDMGLCYSNNHTHFMNYKGHRYLFYHTLGLQFAMMNTTENLTFRSICVDRMDDAKISMVKGTKKGVSSPIETHRRDGIQGTTMATCADIEFEEKDGEYVSKSTAKGAWLLVKQVQMEEEHDKNYGDIFNCSASGKGIIEVRLDKLKSKPILQIKIDSDDIKDYYFELPDGVCTETRDVYVLFSNKDMYLKKWGFYFFEPENYE